MNCYEALTEDIKIRRERLQKTMRDMDIEACILSTGVNVFYMTGQIYNGYFYLPAEGDAIHFVKRPEGATLDRTIYIRKPEQITEELQRTGERIPVRILLETEVLSYSECGRIMKTFGVSEVANASAILRKQRVLKSPFEISQIRESARKHKAVYREIPMVYRKGMTDIELQIEIERLMRLHGSLGIFRSYGENMDIYMGSLLVGENAEVPSPYDYALGGAGTSPALPLGANGAPIKEGKTIMVDMAGNYSPWMTDMTRVFSVGEIPDIAYKAHGVSCEIHNVIKDMLKPGVGCADLWDVAYNIVRENNLEAYFMGTKQQAKFIGHGVGLEINEPPVLTPRSKERFEPNIVFALEPKFVIPEIGAVGIENTYLVTETGVENLTVFEENIIKL